MIIYERLPKRRVGKTTLAVTTLGFGGAPIGNLYRSLSEQNALKTLSTAIKSGVSFFDTAPTNGADEYSVAYLKGRTESPAFKRIVFRNENERSLVRFVKSAAGNSPKGFEAAPENSAEGDPMRMT